MEERFQQCAFETEKVFCEISQEGERCRQFDICYEATTKNGDDLTPEQFCQMNPSWTIDQAVVLRQKHIDLNPDSKTPFRLLHSRLAKLPPVYTDELRQELSSIKR